MSEWLLTPGEIEPHCRYSVKTVDEVDIEGLIKAQVKKLVGWLEAEGLLIHSHCGLGLCKVCALHREVGE